MKQFCVILISFFLLNGVLMEVTSINDSDDEVRLDENFVFHLKNSRQKHGIQKTLDIKLFDVKGKFSRNNSTIKNIWNYPLGENNQIVRITKSRIVHSYRATEYRFAWSSSAESNQSKMVCLPYSQKKPYWYSSNVNFDNAPWPINSYENLTTKIDPNSPSVVEYLFLNSDGFLLHLELNHPWQIGFRKTTDKPERNLFCFSIKNPEKPKPNDHSNQYFSLKFRILVASNIKTVYQSALGEFGYIPRPRTLPSDVSALVNPILPVSSFVQEMNQNNKEADVYQLMNELKMRKFYNFTILFDQYVKWLSTSDSFAFNSTVFPNIQSMLNTIRQSGHKISLTFETFLNSDYCTKDSPTILKNEYCFPDLTQPEAVEWFMEKVRQKLTNPYQIDSVHFTNKNIQRLIRLTSDTYPQDEIVQKYPNSLITSYAQLASRFGAYSTTLDYGLASQAYASVVPTKIYPNVNPFQQIIKNALSLSLGGYQLIQPQLLEIGIWDSATYLRWIQALTFMPVMQIPTVTVQFEDEPKIAEYVRGCIELRRQILEPKLLGLIKKWIQNGEPIIRPMWYADPNNAKFYTVNDQFMVGEDILVAPITSIILPTSRVVYFPPGNWIINKGGQVFSGNYTCFVSKITDFLYFVRL